MPDQPTPGQLCYEAFDAAFPADRFVRLTWDEQAPAVQAAWEAAARAVLAPRLTDQAAQLHHLIDSVVAHAPQAYLDKVHIWLTDLSGIVHDQCQSPLPEEDTP